VKSPLLRPWQGKLDPSTEARQTGCGSLLRILTITPFYPSAQDDGQGCFVSEPLLWMERIGIDNRVLAVQPFYRGRTQPGASTPKADWMRYPSLPGALGLPTAGTFLFSRVLPTVRRLHEVGAIDLIHAHAPLPCGHAAMLLNRELGLPYVVTVHGLDAFSLNQVGGWAGEWCSKITRSVYQSARVVICISEQVRQRVLAGAAGCTTTVVYNGADPSMFSPDPNRQSSANPTVVSVGNLIPIKGHDVLIRAVAAIADQHRGLRCEIVGDGPERDHLEVLVRDLGILDRVTFPGRQSRCALAQTLRRAAVFALPSRYEGLGCVYLEAMACGKVAIGCREQGIEEVIHHGKNGWLVAPDSVEDLASGLATLLENFDLRESIGTRARRTIVEGLTLEHQAERLVRVYRESLA
jgi:teichuronic acid biosynthesis glycosyltransferase TuaC